MQRTIWNNNIRDLSALAVSTVRSHSDTADFRCLSEVPRLCSTAEEGNGLLGVVDGAWARGQSLSEGKIDKGVPDHNEQTVIISLDDRQEYAEEAKEDLMIVMRVYFEK
jgi:hypothetical protein